MEQPDPNPFNHLVEEFERSLKSFVRLFNVEVIENKTNQEIGKKYTSIQQEQNKKIMEQASEEMYEKAINLEKMFVKYRLETLRNAPEQLIQEEINCLRSENKRKDDLLNDAKRKIAICEQNLRLLSNAADNQIRTRLEMSTYNYMSNESVPGQFSGASAGPFQ